MSQPKWKFVANLGDANPLDHGGYFIFVDETGVYPPQAEYLEVDEDARGRSRYTVYRFNLEPCTYINNVLSDNKFHPDKSAWFATRESRRAERPQDTTYLSNLDSITDGNREEDLIASFCSDDPLERAQAWRVVGLYHGFDNLDSYPLHLNGREAARRYKDITHGQTSQV